MDVTTKELLAIFISRQIKDGEQIIAGTNLAVPRAGILLAHYTKCPNLHLQMGGYLVNLLNEEKVHSFEFRGNWDSYGGAGIEAFIPLDFESLQHVDLTFIGGMQIDRYGNTNLIGIKGDNGFKVRGPGTTGIATLTTYVKRYFIFTQKHNKKIFVEKCDYRSSFGWGDGGKDAREKLGLPGMGPEFVITPYTIMDFEEDTKKMRVKYLMPNISIEQVVDSTGFELVIPENIESVSIPTEEELFVLRNKVDPSGILRN
jgi:glutaconate CoA-transferase subunit B